MSSQDSEYTPGMTHGKIGRAAVAAAGTGLALILATDPLFDFIENGGMLLDMMDPYNFAHTFNRASLDGMTKQGYESMQKLISDNPTLRAGFRIAIQARAPTLTAIEVEQQVERALSLWQLWGLEPKNYNACFEDYVNYDASTGRDISFSGAPTARCDPIYKDAYNAYVDANRKRYEEQNIKSSQVAVSLLNEGTDFFNKVEVQVEANPWERDILVVTMLVLASTITVLVFYIIAWRRESHK